MMQGLGENAVYAQPGIWPLPRTAGNFRHPRKSRAAASSRWPCFVKAPGFQLFGRARSKGLVCDRRPEKTGTRRSMSTDTRRRCRCDRAAGATNEAERIAGRVGRAGGRKPKPASLCPGRWRQHHNRGTAVTSGTSGASNGPPPTCGRARVALEMVEARDGALAGASVAYQMHLFGSLRALHGSGPELVLSNLYGPAGAESGFW